MAGGPNRASLLVFTTKFWAKIQKHDAREEGALFRPLHSADPAGDSL